MTKGSKSPTPLPASVPLPADISGGCGGSGTEERQCTLCNENKKRSGYSKNQWNKMEGSKCKGCLNTVERRKCTRCKENIPKSGYSKSQWSKSGGGRKCKGCTDRVVAPIAPKLMDREATEADLVRKNNTIDPKDRLIKFCELNCIIRLGEMNDGILPEKNQVVGRRGEESVSYVSTPYAYWGLPSGGTFSKKAKKNVKKQCSYFYHLDMDWFVKNAELVQPYFEEVAAMPHNGSGSQGMVFTEGLDWGEFVNGVKESIALEGDDEAYERYIQYEGGNSNIAWRRPELIDTEAYRVRNDGTITPKDRLLEFFELSSINHGHGIENEMAPASYPARQTTNRYWGISPRGGTSMEDAHAWDYFKNMEDNWILSNEDLIRPHYDEVTGLGYGRCVVAVRHYIQDELETSGTSAAA